MCGIYGYIGKPSAKALALFQIMGVESEIRGKHATGYYGISGDEVITAKAPLPANEFFKTELFTVLHENTPSMLIGHNRFATHGDPKINENNHPFTSERFGFIHNGVVGSVEIDNYVKSKVKTECDSENIFRFFLTKFSAFHDKVSAIQSTLNHFDSGSLACAMIDNQDRSLYLFRNAGNPINYAYIKKLGIIAFASTEEILATSLKALGIEAEGKIKWMKIGRIFKIKEDLSSANWIVKALREPYYTYTAPTTSTIVSKKPTYRYIKAQKQGCGSARQKWFTCKHCKDIKREFISIQAIMQHLQDKHNITIVDQNDEAINSKHIGYPDHWALNKVVTTKNFPFSWTPKNSKPSTPKIITPEVDEDEDEETDDDEEEAAETEPANEPTNYTFELNSNNHKRSGMTTIFRPGEPSYLKLLN